MSLFTIQLLFVVVILILSGLFSATEVAYTGLGYNQIKRVNRLYPGALRIWEESPNRILATLLISNNAVGTAMGVLAASVAVDLANTYQLNKSLTMGGVGVIASVLLLFAGEILPKILAQRYTIPWALAVTPIMTAWSRVVAPIARGAVTLTTFISFGKLRAEGAGGMPFLDQGELRQILIHSKIPFLSQKLLDNVMDFSHLKVRNVMTPRSDIFAISLSSPMSRVVQQVVQSGWSRVPVYSGQVDQIQGMLYSKDLLVSWRSGTLVVLQDLVRPILKVSPDMPLSELLRLFRDRRQHMAVVRANVGSAPTVGLVTLQDAIEAIVGYIKEED